jgi:hypothetical protein
MAGPARAAHPEGIVDDSTALGEVPLMHRVGPFDVSGTVRAVPGARFLSAVDPRGAQLVLQAAFLRRATGDASSRAAEEARIHQATAELSAAGLNPVVAHGASDLEDGQRVLWWRLADGPPTRALEGQLALVERPDGLDWLGVALAPVPAWAGPGAPPPRGAPGEPDRPTSRGDLWRLGQALRAIAAPEGLPPTWERWLEGLRQGAFSSADEALAALPSKLVPPPRASALSAVRWGPPRAAPPPGPSRPAPPAAPAPAPSPSPGEALDFRTVRERALAVLAEAPIPADLRDTTEVSSVPTPVKRWSMEDQAAVEALAMSWSQPPLPAGESPWSDVDPAPLEPEPDSGVHVMELAPLPPGPRERGRARPGFDPGRAGLGALIILLIFGAIALLVRPETGVARPAALALVPSSHVARIETDPPGGLVLGRRDGRALGRAPLDFLVPEGASASVLVALEGHEPAGLALPDRGTVTVRLRPLDAELGCTLPVEAGVELERWPAGTRVGRAIEVSGGATVVRARPGQARAGARIVRCPSLGGAPRARVKLEPAPDARRLRVSRPPGAAVRVDGRPLGRAPVDVEVAASFVRVAVERLDVRAERWVPIAGDSEVHVPLPAPSPRRRTSPRAGAPGQSAGLVAPSR